MIPSEFHEHKKYKHHKNTKHLKQKLIHCRFSSKMTHRLSCLKELQNFFSHFHIFPKETSNETDYNSVQVDQHQNKSLSVPKSYAWIKPWAMMIHVQNTYITSGAMMSSVWFKDVANHAVPFSGLWRVPLSKSPIERDVAWVCC